MNLTVLTKFPTQLFLLSLLGLGLAAAPQAMADPGDTPSPIEPPIIDPTVDPVFEFEEVFFDTYSEAGADFATVFNQFSISNSIDGKFITDSNSDSRIGVFTGAAFEQNFGRGRICTSGVSEEPCINDRINPPPGFTNTSRFGDNSSTLYNPAGFPVFSEPFIVSSTFTTGTLTARRFGSIEEYLFEDGTGPLESVSPIITYTISNPSRSVSYFLRDIDTISGFDRVKATNSLRYILENNLINRSVLVLPPSQPGAVRGFPGNGLTGDIYITDRTRRSVNPPQSVPESSGALGYLGLAAMTGLWLKQKQGWSR
jgi:hypothetical protein